MGDHRASIKIECNIHGKDYAQEFWINYCPDYDGVDERIKEFFRASWEDSLEIYHERVVEYERAEAERQELATLRELQAKYPTEGAT